MPMKISSRTMEAPAVRTGRTAHTSATPRTISNTMRAGAARAVGRGLRMPYPATCCVNSEGVSPLAIPENRKIAPRRIRPACPRPPRQDDQRAFRCRACASVAASMSSGPPLRDLAAAIQPDLDLLERGESLRDCGVDDGQEPFDLVLGIDNLDDDRQVLGEAQDLGGVKAAVGAEPLHPPQHRGSRQALLARLPYDPLVQGRAVVPIALPHEDPEKMPFLGQHHGSLPPDQPDDGVPRPGHR